MVEQVEVPGMITAGNTPLVSVNGIANLGYHCPVLAKLEGHNPTKSMKIRSALAILNSLNLPVGSVVIESTSGNMGVALAAVAQERNLGCVLVVDPKLSPYHRREMLKYGASLREVTEVDDTGGWLKTRLATVKALVEQFPHWHWVNQYSSPANPLAFETLGREILMEVFGFKKIWLFASVSTGGSLSGVAKVLTKMEMNGTEVRVIAVDAYGSAIFGGAIAKRYLNGIGSSLANPPLLRRDLIDGVCIIKDQEAFEMCHRMKSEGIYAGGSSGAVMAAIQSRQDFFTKNDVVVGIFPDDGEIYQHTIYSGEWLAERGFNINAMAGMGQ
jgi:cysteine synthase